MTTRRSSTRPWLFAIGAVSLILLVLAVSGGFSPAGPRIGPLRTPGEAMAAARWEIRIDSAEVITRSSGERTLVSLNAEVTNLTDAYLGYLNQGLVSVVLPDGSVQKESYIPDPGNGFGNPGVRTPVKIEVEIPTQPPGDVPLTIIIRDERDAGSYVTAERWTPTTVLGHVTLIALDAR